MTTARAFLSRAEAAEYVQSHGLPLARGTLQKYATTGEGPRYHKFGQRCVYRREGLDAWMATKLGRPVTPSSPTSTIRPKSERKRLIRGSQKQKVGTTENRQAV